jgi:hypothetical protein
MMIEQTTHGFKVLSDDGNEEIDFFNTEKEALEFMKGGLK